MNTTTTRNQSRLHRWSALLTAVFLAATALLTAGPGAAHAALIPDTAISVGGSPSSMAVSPDGATLYVANSGGGTVSVIDTATNTLTETVPVGANPSSMAVSPDGATLYVANSGGGTVSVIDTATNTLTETVPVGANPSSMVVSPDGASVYVANSGDGTVSVIDTATNIRNLIFIIGTAPSSAAVSPDGTRVYITYYEVGSLVAIHTAVNGVGDPVPVGAKPSSVVVSPDGARVYVANEGDNTVSVIDSAANTLTETVPVGAKPSSVVVSPDGARVYVANEGDNTVSVFREVLTVTFDPNGGAGTMADQSANAAAPLTPGAFTREGYTFTGWNTTADGAGTSYADGTDYAFTTDATLYAQWAVVDYTISYDLAGGITDSPANPITYTVETAPVTLTAPTQEGFTFTGWTGTGLTEPTLSVTVPTGSTGDRDYTATWEANPAATLVITGPATVTELDTNPLTVEAFDAHGVSLGDVTGEVTFTGADVTGADVTGADVTFPIDYAVAGQTTTRDLTATLDSDSSVTGTLNVEVVSAVTDITVSAPATVKQGDTITVEVTATGATGVLGDATEYAVITSNVPTDVVDGPEVSFLTASPHTLTATLGVLTATHTVDVESTATDTPTPTPDTPTPDTPTPPTPTPGTQPTPTPATTGGLPTTGANFHGGALVTAGLFLALGAALTITTYRRRRS